jgi:Fe-only nitrogenase accessory protein AnfO
MATSTVPDQIAGFVEADGTLTDLFGAGVVRIFRRGEGLWQTERDIPFTLEGTTSLGAMRAKLHGLADAMADCKVIMVGEVKGVLPALLGEKGVAVSQVSGDALARLALVPLEPAPKDATEAAAAEPAPVAPIEVDRGIFRINLAAAMKDYPRLTSRQILIPLLSKGGFTLLEVLCEHPPRWLDTDGRKLGYGYESAPQENPRDGFVVTLYPDSDACTDAEACSVLTNPGGCGSGGCGSRHSDEFVEL